MGRNSHRSCCVVICKNTSIKGNCKFYKFPTAKWKINQKRMWIAAVKWQNPDGSQWIPKSYDYICSDHFIGGKKSEEELSPSYIPTIFPPIYKYRNMNELSSTSNNDPSIHEFVQIMTENPPVLPQKVDQGCQVDFHTHVDVYSQTFTCNRYIKDEICHADTQTEITEVTGATKVNYSTKKYATKNSGTVQKAFVDQESQVDDSRFAGFSSITKDHELIDIAGVTFENFEFLLKRVSTLEKCIVSKKDRLLIFLMKMKSGLTFSALSVLFNVHRTTISRIFSEILQKLAVTTRNLVFWPDIDAVQETMPECFHPQYSNTRVIIDCTEFRIEIPASVDNRIYTYSQYKKNFTAKVLIGVTPGGFICFKSKIAGRRMSDSQLTIESGLLDLLEDGDTVLANKEFPEIKTLIDSSDKKIKIIMPPFLEKNNEFTNEQTHQTYNVARVRRIHMERIMQRLRTYGILNKIPENLFHCIDDIMHVCCVLVNLQPPEISNKKDIDNR